MHLEIWLVIAGWRISPESRKKQKGKQKFTGSYYTECAKESHWRTLALASWKAFQMQINRSSEPWAECNILHTVFAKIIGENYPHASKTLVRPFCDLRKNTKILKWWFSARKKKKPLKWQFKGTLKMFKVTEYVWMNWIILKNTIHIYVNKNKIHLNETLHINFQMNRLIII